MISHARPARPSPRPAARKPASPSRHRHSTTMKLIVGLGNPGPQYARTRHNAGFLVLDRLAQLHAQGQLPKSRFAGATLEPVIAGEKCLLLKPMTYMNRSGAPVAEALRFHKLQPEDTLVVVDDLYLPVGSIRLRPSGGTGGHNGLADIHRALGHDAYPRLRVGVGLQPAGGKPPLVDQADFVLSRFTQEESAPLEESIARAAGACEAFVRHGLAHAMNTFNPETPKA